MQIGAVAEATGLSLRTIRYYGEVGLVPPSARSAGGFRLYTAADVARLRVIMRMKPLDFTLEEMKGVLDVLDELQHAAPGTAEHQQLTERLAMYHIAAQARVTAVREQLEIAEAFASELEKQLTRASVPTQSARRRHLE